MLIHIAPSCYSPFKEVALVDLSIAELELVLTADRDLATRRPHPNKRYAVACRRRAQKAINGILIDAPPLRSFTVVTRWALNADFIATHRVDYEVLDENHDAVSDRMSYWYGTAEGLPNRWPADIQGSPLDLEPRMELIDPRKRDGVLFDRQDPATGMLAERHERFAMPSIERSRIVSRFWSRTPPICDAFDAPMIVQSRQSVAES